MYTRILVPLDGSAKAEQALEVARQLARPEGCELHLLVAINLGQVLFAERLERLPADFEKLGQQQLQEGRRYLGEVQSRLGNEGISAHIHVVQAEPREAIVKFAHDQQMELVVMTSTSKHSWLQRLSGSIVEQVLRSASCPVLVVRPPVSD